MPKDKLQNKENIAPVQNKNLNFEKNLKIEKNDLEKPNDFEIDFPDMFLDGEDFESIDSEKMMKKQLEEINKEQEKLDLYKFRLSASPFIPKKAIGGKFGGLEHTVYKKQQDQPKSCFSGYAPSEDLLQAEVNQTT